MNVVEIVFSPTGGTEKVAHIIGKQWSENPAKIDLSDAKADFTKCGITEQDMVLIAMPSFGGQAPAAAIERLKQISGNGAKCMLVCVYGNRAYEDTLVEMEDAAKECGFQVVAAGAFIAEHSIARSIATGRPDTRDLEIAGDFGAQVMKKLSGGELTSVQVPGNPGYRDKVGKPSPHPAAGESCVGCGTCAKNCPVGAIPLETPAETDGSKCINCMRCIAICPMRARALPEAMLTAVEGMLKQVASEPKQPELFL